MTIPQWMLEASFILIIATPALAWVAYLGFRAFERWRYPLYRARLSPPVRIGHTNHVHVAGMDDDEDDEGFETPRYSHPRGEEGKFDPTDPYEHSVIRNMIDPNEIEVEDEGEDEFDDGSVDYGSDPAALRRTEASPEEVDPAADSKTEVWSKTGVWADEILDLQGQLRSAGYRLVGLPEFADDGTYWEHPHGDQVAMQVTKDFARIWVFTRKGGMYEFEEYINEHSEGQE